MQATLLPGGSRKQAGYVLA